MPDAICRQQFFFRHASGDPATLMRCLSRAMQDFIEHRLPVTVVRFSGDATIDIDACYVVAVIDAPLGWELMAMPILEKHALTCRRYI